MFRKSLIQLVSHFANASNENLPFFELSKAAAYNEESTQISLNSFLFQLREVADSAKFHFDLRMMKTSDFKSMVKSLPFPLLAFSKKSISLQPLLISKSLSGELIMTDFEDYDKPQNQNFNLDSLDKLCKSLEDVITQNELDKDFGNETTNGNNIDYIVYLTGFKISNMDDEKTNKPKTPIQRFFDLLKEEKKDIYSIYFFAILVALITLTIPLGIQAIIGLMSGGLLLESALVLIFLVILATLASGWLQVQQLSLVEILQQRIFAKTAFDFSFRIPRIKSEVLSQQYTPEIVNRFFDVLNVQKSLPKILIDFTSALIQIFFGLLLLSFYHPYFILFGIIVLVVVGLVFVFTSKSALESSIYESKYKYKLAFWLEELGRSVHAFKMSAYNGLPVNKTDYLLDKYLHYRKKHFKILVKQFAAIIAFKTIITAGLLILGGVLVFNRQINLGQFVASEIIILLVIGSVEKIISNISSVYDMLTAIDKLATVSDLPLESSGGRSISDVIANEKFELKLSHIGFKYPDSKNESLKNINFQISKGEKICICGYNDSGKSTLLKVVSGAYESYDGAINLNGVSLREINLNSYRSLIADVGNATDLFEGSIEENISMGNNSIPFKDILNACEWAGLKDFVANLHDGLKTQLAPAAANFPSNIAKKILLARAYITKPSLMMIDEMFHQVQRQEKQKILENIFNEKEMALIIISSLPEIMEKCDKVYIMQSGSIVDQGTYSSLNERSALRFLTNLYNYTS
jgi:ABC-type bacteriocin/lantibiotic exporter with double-glycine peptidase domain